VHVPAGRGPFISWEAAAIDALVNCAPYAARNADWSIGPSLTKLEEYNGLGYAARGLPSPYLWSGTDQYKSGKYVRDGVYDPNAVDSQLGCAGLLKAMAALDPSAAFATKNSLDASDASSPARQSTPVPPSLTNPSRGSIAAFVVSIYVLAIAGGAMNAIDSIGNALGDPNLRDQINNAIGDARVAGRILLGISIITILARLRSLRKTS
jgi:hypothetical protein